MPRHEIDRFLAQCHIPPPRIGATLDERDLVRIGSFPVFLGSINYQFLVLPFRSCCGHTRQLSCSNRRPAVSPAMINVGTMAITTPNAFSDGGRFL
jgi:hypothetical protein